MTMCSRCNNHWGANLESCPVCHPQAEGPATKEPEQSPSLPPGSPSGVVEALRPDGRVYYYRTGFGHTMIQLEDGYYNGAKPYKAEAYYLESNPGLCSLPQAPATPAAAPVEGDDGKFPICQNCTTSDLTVRHIPPVTNCPNTPAPGVEAPRKEARETQLFTREVCPECKNSDVADCLGALPCPHCSGGYIYTEVREGDNHE